MADRYIRVEIETDPSVLADDAVASLQQSWPDWEPEDSDQEVKLIEAVAPMAASAAETAAIVPSAIFRKFGTDFANVPYETGAYAYALAVFTMNDTVAHTVPANVEFSIDGYAFRTTADGVSSGGATNVTPGVPALCSTIGTAPNDLPGADVSMISALSFVQSVAITGSTAGGEDPEDDDAYQDRLTRELQLQARTLVVPRDFELMALTDPEVARAKAVHDGQRRVQLVTVNELGLATTPTGKARLLAVLNAYRLVNTVITISDATYTPIHVSWTVKALPDVDFTALAALTMAAVTDALQPYNWGQPSRGRGDARTPAPLGSTNIVRVNKLVDLIADVPGVDYVDTVTLLGGVGNTAPKDANGNVLLSGTVALTTPGTLVPTVT